MPRPAQRRLVYLTTAFALSLLSCGREVTGPENGITIGRRIGNIAIAPQMPTLMQVVQGAGDAVPFTRVRVVLRNVDGSIAKDTMVDFPSNADSVALALQLPIPLTSPDSGLALSLTMAYVNASGDTVFRGGPNSIVARPLGTSGANVPVVIPVTYDGAGKDAARVAITPKTGTGVAGTTRAFSGTAFDAQNAPIANTPFVFFSTDTLRAKVNASTGVASWQAVRGLARIVAALPNGNRADTATFLISLPASKLVLGAGAAQTGAVNAPLADSIVLRTLASDDVPVGGVIVNFVVATGGGSLLALTDTSDINGNVSTKWTLGAALGAQTITATATGLTGSPLTGSPFTISATGVAGTASRLDITAQPSSATAGVPFAPAIVVQARDAFGNLATNFTGNVSIAMTGAQAPPLGGTAIRAAVGGIATFSDLSINVVGSYTLAVTSGALTPDTTTSIGIRPAAAAVLEFVSEPAGAVAGAAFVPPVTVRARDAFGNVDTAFTGTVALSLLNGGSAVLSGSTSQAAVSGLATFSSLSVNLVGATYSLRANSGALTPDTSSVFGITPSAPTQISLIGGGAQTGAVSAALAQPIVVEVRDAQGNLVPGATVNFSIVTGGGTALPPNAATNASGQASTVWTMGSALGAQEARASLAVAPTVFVAVPATATPGVPAQVVITQAPSAAVAGTAFAPVVTAEVRDASGNVVTSFAGNVSLTFGSAPPTAALFGTTTVAAVNGVATFNGLSAQRAGAGYTLVASAAGFNSLPSAVFAVAPSTPAQFGILDGNNQTGVAGGVFPSPLRVYVRDQFGNPIAGAVTSWNAQGVVTLAQTSVLSDVNGVAANTATMGSIPGAQARGPTVTTAGVDTTVIFAHTVTAGAAAQVVVTQAPSAGVAGVALPVLVAEVRDALGNVVPTYTGLVEAALSTNPSSTTLAGTLSVNAVAGVATFNNLIINGAAVGYRLRARLSVEGYESAESAAFNVAAAAPASIAFVSGQTQSGAAGALMPDSIIVVVRDAFNNPVAGQSVTFAALAGASSVSQTSVLTNAAGRAAVRANFGNTVGGPLPGVRATTPGVGTVLETTVSIAAGAASQLAVTTTPFASVIAGTPFSISALVRDALGNTAVAFTDSISIAILSGPGGATLSGITRLPAVTGAREFAALSLDRAGTYQLVVSATGLASANTFSFNVTPAAAATLTLAGGNAQTGAVNTTLANSLDVQARDAFNNAIVGALVTWTVSSGAANMTVTTSLTDANGVASSGVVLGTTTGAVTVAATLAPLPAVNFTATATAGAPVSLAEVVAPTSGIVGTALPSFSYVVRDQFGNTATSHNNVTAFATLQNAAAGQGTPEVISGASVLVANGVATWNGYIARTAGQYRIVADFGGTLGTITSGIITIAPGAAAVLESVSGDAQSGVVVTNLANPLRVRVTDTYGNGVSGVTVNFSSLGGFASFSNPVPVTDGAGVAEGVVTLGDSATVVTLVATVAGLTPDSLLFTATALPGAANGFFLVSGDAQTAQAGVAAPDSVIVRVHDAYGNNAPGVTVTFSTADDLTFSNAVVVSDAAGLAATRVIAGASLSLRNFTAGAAGASPIALTVTVVPGDATTIDIVSAAVASTIAGLTLDPVTVNLRDALGNVATAYTDSVVVSIQTGPVGATLGGTLRRAAPGGVASFTNLSLDLAGAYSLRVERAGLTSDTTPTFNISAAAPASVTLISGNTQSGAVSSTLPLPLVVEVRDVFNNVVPGAGVLWSVTTSAATPGSSAVITDANGRASTTLQLSTVPGPAVVNATVLALTPVVFNATAVAGTAVTPVETVAPAGATAGAALGSFSYSVEDQFGNLATSYSGTATVSLQQADAGQPVPVIVSGDTAAVVNGVATWNALLVTSAGQYRIVADFGGTLGTVTSGIITIAPAAASVLTAESGGGQSGVVLTDLPQPFVARVTDVYGNGVPDVLVNWSAPAGFFTYPAVVTGSDGRSVNGGRLTDSATTVTIGAFVPGLTPATVQFTATGLPAAAASFVVVSGDAQTAPAGGVAVLPVVVRVIDAYGNNRPGVAVTFSSSGDLSFSTPNVVSDTNGLASTNVIAGGTLGLQTFYAQTAGVTDRALTVTIVPGAPAAIVIVAAPSNTVAGVALGTLNAEVRDALGNLVTAFTDSLDVVIESGPGGATLSGDLRVAAVGGVATFTTLSLESIGDYSLRVERAGLSSDTTATLTVTAAAADSMSYVSGTAQSMLPEAEAADSLVVRVLDAFGNPVAGESVTWAVSLGTASLSGVVVPTDVDGYSRVSLTATQTAGAGEVTAAVAGLTGSPVSFSFTTTAASAARLAFTVNPSTDSAGGSQAFQLRALDTFGNLATSFVGTVTVSVDSGPASPALTGTLVDGAVGGVADFTDFGSLTAGVYRLRASAAGVADTVSANFSILPASPSAIAVDAGDAQSAAVGSALATPLRVRLADMYDNPIAAATIDWSVLSGDVTLGGLTSVTDAAGLATNTVLLGGTPGSFSIRAVSAAANDTAVFMGTSTAGAASTLVLTAEPVLMTAGDASATFTIEAQDALGNLATSFVGPVTVDILSGPTGSFAAGTLNPSATLGAVSFTDLVLNTSGNYVLRFSTAFDTVTTDPLTVVGAAAEALSVSIEPSGAVAGVTLAAVQVVARDAFGNDATSAGNEVTVSVLTGPAGNPLTGTLQRSLSTGVVEFTDLGLTTAGEYTLLFSSAGLASDTSAAFTITAAAASELAEVSGSNQTVAVNATTPDSLVVRVQDEYGNGVAGQTVNWGVTGEASLSAATSVTDANGEAFVFASMGNSTGADIIEASVFGLTNSPVSFSVTVVAGAPVRLIIQGTLSSATAGVIGPVTVNAVDSEGNIALPFTGEVRARIVTGPVGAPIFGDSVLNATAGTVTFSALQALIAGPYTLEFVSAGLFPDTSNAFNITPDIATNLNLISGNTQTDTVYSTSDTLIVRVTDQYGNGIDGAAVSWNLAIGGGVLTLQQTEADVDGYARALVTHGGTPDVITVEASSGTLIGSPVSFTLTATPAPATSLRVVSSPATVVSGATGEVIAVEAVDAYLNRDTTFVGLVTLSASDTPPGSTLGGTLTATAVNGLATFNAFSLDLIGDYTLDVQSATVTATFVNITVLAGAPANLSVISGDTQTGFTTLALVDPLLVSVTDAAGNAVAGDTVVFTVLTGGGSVSTDSAITNGDGQASTNWTLGSLVGVQSVQASAVGTTPVTFAATAGLPSFEWTGNATDGVWSNPGNWIDGVVPGATSVVLIPETIDHPTSIAAGQYAELTVIETSAISLDGVVTVTGSVTAPLGLEQGLTCGTGDSLIVSPAGAANLGGGLACPIVITSGTVTLSELSEFNSLTISGGDFSVGENEVTIGGSLVTSGTGTVHMTDALGLLRVDGSATWGGGNLTGMLTAGRFEARSGFSVTADNGFAASGSHRTVLGGNFLLDFYTFALPASLGHRFGILELAPQSLQHAVGTANRIDADSLLMPSGGTLVMTTASDTVRVSGSVRTSNSASIDASLLEVGGSYSYPGIAVIDTVVFTGIGQRLPFSSETGVVHSFQDVFIEGTVQTLATAGDSLVVPNVLNVRGTGSLRFGQDGGVQTRARIGVLRTVQDGVVGMQNAGDSVYVSMEANFAGGSTAGLLTNGTLIVGGTLSQLAIASTESFSASADHLTIVRPASFAELYFMNPGTGAGTSGIASLRIEEDNLAIDTVFFRSDVHVRGMLLDAPTDTMVLASNNATQRTLESWGADVGGLRFSRVNWRITGQAAFTGADDLLFTDQDSTVTQFELRGADATVSMSNVTFFVPPSTGRYLRLEDTNGGAPFTLNTSNWSPGFHNSAISLVGGALLTGWAEFPAFTWVGGTSTDFGTASNWLANRIPGAGDSIVVTPGASNTLTITGERSLGSLYLASGAALIVQDTLIVAGSFNTEAGSLSCVFGGNAIRIQNASGTPRDLSLAGTDCNVFIEEGTYDLQGASASARNLTVNGTGYLNLNNRRLETADNFGTLNTGRIEMNEAGDSLIVGGQAFFQGGSTTGLITDGFIYVRNTFAQGGLTASAFRASGTNRAVIGDTLTAFADSVDFSFSRPDSSWFNNVRVFNGPWTIDNAVRARVLTTVGGATLTGGGIQTDSILTFSSGSTVALRRITTLGSFFPSNSFAVDTMNFMGSLIGPEQVIPALASGSTYRTVNVYNNARIQSAAPQVFRVAQRLEVFNGQLNVQPQTEGGGPVSIAADTADLIIGGSGRLAMRTTGTVSVDSAHFGGLSTSGYMTDGRLQIRGALVQRSDVSGESFRPDSAHITVFRDSVLVDIQDTVNSKPAYVEFGDSLVMTLKSNLEIYGTLTRQAGISDSVVIKSDVLTGAPRRLLVTGATMLDQSGTERTVFRNVALAIIQNSAVTPTSAELNNVTFTNMDPEATQLDLTQYLGYTSSFSRIDFATPVTTGKYFDLAGTSTVSFSTTTPSVGCINAPEGCFGPRSEPSAGVENVFIGDNGDDWGNFAFWSLGRVPTSYDNVTLVGGSIPFLPNSGITRYVNNLTIDPSVSFFMDAAELVLRGNLSVGAGAGIFGVSGSIVRMQPNPGRPVTLGGGGNIDDVALFISAPESGTDSTVTLVGGGLDVSGTVTVEGGRFDIGGQTLQVGSLATTGTGRFSMLTATDSVYVIGNASFAGASTDGLLTNGKLVVGGDISQTTSATAFAASSSHQTYLLSGGTALNFANPGTSASHFGNLIMLSADSLGLLSDVFVNGVVDATTGNLPVAAGATNRLLQASGISTSGAFLFSNVRLRLVDGAAFSFLNAMYFYTMDPTVDYLTIDRSGGAVSLPQMSFSTIPTTGKYVVVIDTVSNADDLVVTINDVLSGGHGGYIDSVGVARIVGWDQLASYTFTGSASNDLGDPANWDAGILPSATSNVTIANVFPADPVTLGGLSYRSLTIASGAQVTINAPITATRSVALTAVPACTSNGRLNLQGDGGTRTLAGSAPTCAVQMTNGAFVLADSAEFRSLTIGNDAQLLLFNDTLVVTDSLAIVGSGRMQMDDSPTEVTVQGIARFTGTGFSNLNGGTLNVWSALEVGAQLAAPTTRLVLGNPNVATTVTARTSVTLDQGFDSVFVLNGTLNILDSLLARRYLGTLGSNITVTGGTLRVGSYDDFIDGTLDLGATGDLTVNHLALFGTIGSVDGFSVDTTSFLGQQSGPQEIPAANAASTALNYGRVRVYADAIMNQVPTGIPFAYTISDALEVLVGQLTIGDSVTLDTVYVNMPSADLVVYGAGARVLMTHPSRVVADSVHIQGSGESQFLDGRVVTRSFAQLTYDNPLALMLTSSGPHTVDFLPNGTVYFQQTDQAKLANVRFTGGGVTTFPTSMYATSIGRVNQTDGIVTLSGGRIFANGTNFDITNSGLVMDNTGLSLQSGPSGPVGGSFTLNNVTFRNWNPSRVDDALWVYFEAPYAATFTNITFDYPQPASGYYFRNFVTSQGTVTFVNASPSLDCLAGTCNPSDIAPSGAPAGLTTWDGSESNIWTDAGNWSNGVPNAGTNAVIPTGVSPVPTLFSSAQVRSLSVETGATLQVDAGDTLHVFGDLDVDGTVSGAAYSSVLRMRTGSAGATLAATGSIRLPLFISAATGSDTGTVSLLDVVNVDTLPTFGAFNGGVRVLGGTLHMNGQDLVTNGSFRTLGTGRLRMDMATDSLHVGSWVIFDGASTDGMITDGVIVALDDFLQDATNSPYSFVATGNNRVVLYGSKDGDVEFQSGGPSGSRFAHLVFDKLSGPGLFFFNNSGNATPTYASTFHYESGDVWLDQGSLIVSSTVTSANPSNTWTLADETSLVDLQGVNQTTCDGLSFTVENLPQLFQPNSCYSLPASSTWNGLSSTNWDDAGNWSDGVPSAVTGAVIPAAPANQPTVRFSTLVGPLTVEAGATLTLNSFRTLDIFGSLDVAGTVNAGNTDSKLRIRSSSAETRTLAAPGSIATRLEIDVGLSGDEGTVQLAGPVNLTATNFQSGLYLNAGILDVNGQTLSSQGGLRVTGSGILEMNQATDSVFVSWNVLFDGADSEGYLTNGTLVSAQCCFTQSNTTSDKSFVATDNHRVVFSGGDNGSQVDLQTSSPTTSRFNHLRFEKTGGQWVYFYDDTVYTRTLDADRGNMTIDIGSLIVLETATFSDSIYVYMATDGILDIQGAALGACATGSVFVEGYTGNFRPTSCHTAPLVWSSYNTNATTYQWNDIAASSATQLAAVGQGGAFAFASFGGGDTWDFAIPSGTTENLNAVSGVAGSFWAVGDSGTIVSKLSGQGFTTVTTVGTAHLRGVLAFSSDSIYAVGDGGTILFFNGSSWTSQSSPTGANLYDIALTQRDGLVAVGSGGDWVTSTGDGTWNSVFNSNTTTLRTIVDVDIDGYFAGGDGGVMREKWRSTVYNFPSQPNNMLAGAAFNGLQFMVGANGQVSQKMGYTWVTITGPSGETLRGATVLNNTPFNAHLFVVGYNGTIYRAQLNP